MCFASLFYFMLCQKLFNTAIVVYKRSSLIFQIFSCFSTSSGALLQNQFNHEISYHIISCNTIQCHAIPNRLNIIPHNTYDDITVQSFKIQDTKCLLTASLRASPYKNNKASLLQSKQACFRHTICHQPWRTSELRRAQSSTAGTMTEINVWCSLLPRRFQHLK